MQIQDAITEWLVELGYTNDLGVAVIDSYKRDFASRVES